MAEEFSEKRMMKLFEIANMIAGVYSSGSYNGYTHEHGADIDYPIWFEFGVKPFPWHDSTEFRSKKPTLEQIRGLYEFAKEKYKDDVRLHTFQEVVMSGKCKFGSNFMYVFWTAESILRKLEGEREIFYVDTKGNVGALENL